MSPPTHKKVRVLLQAKTLHHLPIDVLLFCFNFLPLPELSAISRTSATFALVRDKAFPLANEFATSRRLGKHGHKAILKLCSPQRLKVLSVPTSTRLPALFRKFSSLKMLEVSRDPRAIYRIPSTSVLDSIAQNLQNLHRLSLHNISTCSVLFPISKHCRLKTLCLYPFSRFSRTEKIAVVVKKQEDELMPLVKVLENLAPTLERVDFCDDIVFSFGARGLTRQVLSSLVETGLMLLTWGSFKPTTPAFLSLRVLSPYTDAPFFCCCSLLEDFSSHDFTKVEVFACGPGCRQNWQGLTNPEAFPNLKGLSLAFRDDNEMNVMKALWWEVFARTRPCLEMSAWN